MMSGALWKQHGASLGELNWRTSIELGDGWAEVLLPGPFAEQLKELSPRAHLLVSRFIVEQQFCGAQIESFGFSSTDSLLAAIVLLPSERLHRYACHIGVLSMLDEIKQVIGRTEVELYRSALKDELYEFALYKAPLMGVISASTCGYQGFSRIMDAIASRGYGVLQRLCEVHGTVLWRRVRWKLRRNISVLESENFVGIEELRHVAQRVLREVEAEWITRFDLRNEVT